MAKSTKLKTHTFNGTKYNIFVRPSTLGITDIGNNNDYELNIFDNLKTKRGLITAIHEALHASDWRASEEKVDRISKEIGTFLWRLGYRYKV